MRCLPERANTEESLHLEMAKAHQYPRQSAVHKPAWPPHRRSSPQSRNDFAHHLETSAGAALRGAGGGKEQHLICSYLMVLQPCYLLPFADP